MGVIMSILKRKSQGILVPIHADNAKTKDWVVLLEAATIVGESRDKLRVALTTLERHLVRKKKLFRTPQYFLVIDGYDPRIHGLYFCPQLYRKEDGGLIPLSGQEIGQLMAQAMEGGAVEKLPWYQPSDRVPEEPIIDAAAQVEFDSLVVAHPSLMAKNRLFCTLPPPEKEKVKTRFRLTARNWIYLLSWSVYLACLENRFRACLALAKWITVAATERSEETLGAQRPIRFLVEPASRKDARRPTRKQPAEEEHLQRSAVKDSS